MKIKYYPGCAQKNSAINFEESSILAMNELGIELEELDRWNCCGTVYSMTQDNLMLQMGAFRNLLRVEAEGADKLVTMCSMCYNTLKRANSFIKASEKNMKKINDFMYMEDHQYQGNVEVLHLLEVLDRYIGYKKVKDAVKNPLNGIKVGSYYGCMLVRPKEYSLDSRFEDPDILERLLDAIGCKPVDFPYKLECCGSYQVVSSPDMVQNRTYKILMSAKRAGCEALITSCPLCAYNLDQMQRETQEAFTDFEGMPVFYFTELLYLALKTRWFSSWNKYHYFDILPILREKKILGELV